ncbi:MAG: hypothetical protein R3B82_24590 [Sandaracinaceae bacterium]
MKHAAASLAVALAVVASALAVVGCGANRAVVITDRPLTDRDLAMAWSRADNRDSGDFSEQLKAIVMLPDGGKVYVRLSVTNVAKYDGRAELLGKVELADGRTFRVKTARDRDEWEYADDHFYAKVGESTVDVNVGKAVFHVVGDDFVLDLTITSDLPPLRPGGGTFDRGGAFYATTLPIPRGAAEATLRVQALAVKHDEDEEDGGEGDEEPAAEEGAAPSKPLPPAVEAIAAGVPDGAPGTSGPAAPAEGEGEGDDGGVDRAQTEEEEVHELEGVGYVEHRATNLAPYRMATRWFKVSDVTAERTVAISAFERTEELGGGIQGWVLVVEGDEIQIYEPDVLVNPQQATRDDETGYEVPEHIFFLRPNDFESFQGVVRVNELTKKQDDLSSLSRLERIVVKRLMKPWTYRYDAADFLFKRRVGEAGELSILGVVHYEYQVLN